MPTMYHLTDDPDFQVDPARRVIGWGVKNHAPCEEMFGVLYLSPLPSQWTFVGGWDRRRYVAEVVLADAAVEGVDFHHLSDRVTLVVNLDVVTVVAVARQELRDV